MKKSTHIAKDLLCLVLLCVATAACKDNDYDLTHIDATVGVGSDVLEIPTSSTKYITLDDVLELKGNDLVKTDPATGYYYMDKADDRVAPINITVPESVSGTSGDAQNTITLPETPVSSFGSVTIDNAPEFLSDDNTVLKLDNPQFILTVNSNLPAGATIAGDLCSFDEMGKKIATVHVDGVRVEENSTSVICICRHADGIDAAGYTQVKEISNLHEIMPVLPHRITFDATVKPDAVAAGAVTPGRTYTLRPRLRFTAPLTFQEGSTIVYSFVENEWNRDFEKISFTDDAYIMATLDADNGIPAEMEVTAIPVDVNGKEISKDKIEVSVIQKVAASPDGVTRVVTPITLKMTENSQRAMYLLDGLKFTFKGHPAAGIQLNSRTQTLRLNDIKIYFIGKLAVDMNK